MEDAYKPQGSGGNSPSLAELSQGLLNNPELLQNIKSILNASPPQATGAPESGTGTAADLPPGEAVNGSTSPPNVTPPSGGSANSTDGLSALLSNPAVLEKLPAVMAMLRPMLSGTSGAPAGAVSAPTSALSAQSAHPASHTGDRDHLLLSLKPFLSPTRQEAIDTIMRIAQLGSLLEQIK